MQEQDEVKKLLAQGADIHEANSRGMTPLRKAIMKHDYQMMCILYAHCANPDFKKVCPIFGKSVGSAREALLEQDKPEVLEFCELLFSLPRERVKEISDCIKGVSGCRRKLLEAFQIEQAKQQSAAPAGMFYEMDDGKSALH